MQHNDINIAIAEITSIYTNLNNCWGNDQCATDVYQAYRQKEYHESYEKLKDFNFESIILDIIANRLDEKILLRLRNLLNENIQIYQTRQNQFTNIDFQEVYTLQQKRLFDDKFALLAKDKEDIQNFPYPTERERQMLLKENQTERNQLDNERYDYIRSNIWMIKNFYSLIAEISKSFLSIIESYFPVEKEKISEAEPINDSHETTSEPEQGNVPAQIEPDMIFRTGKYDKFLALESKLINDKYLNSELHWISTHENGKADIKSLIIFLIGLLDNRYFLPGKDPKIKLFFESRYHITIGQNFERRRREPLLNEYKITFYDYDF